MEPWIGRAGSFRATPSSSRTEILERQILCFKEARLVRQVELGFSLSTYWLSTLLHLSVSRLPKKLGIVKKKLGIVNHGVCGGWGTKSVCRASGLVPGTK